MLRQVSSRNQRGKGGFKLKNALQLCLLVALCVWLLYQMEHSHDKKKAYEERGLKVSSKGDERQLGITKFGRKDIPRTVDLESEDEDEGGNGDDQDQEEASQKARETSFRGDDASSEVVHIIQEVEHEEGSHEARERSFKADDVSSSVAHVPQVNEAESESKLVNRERKDGETQNVANRTHEGSSASKLVDNSKGNHSNIIQQGSETVHNTTVISRAEPPILENVSPPNTTAGEPANHKEQQPDLRIESVISNQTSVYAIELPTNLTAFSKKHIYFQKNSTTVSVDWHEAPANSMVKVDPSNVSAIQNQTITMHPIDGQTDTVKLETRGDEKPDLEKKVIVQKTDTIVREEE